MYRQGDVLIEAVGEIPKREKSSETLLVRGEGRNHGHFIKSSDASIYQAHEGELTSNGGI